MPYPGQIKVEVIPRSGAGSELVRNYARDAEDFDGTERTARRLMSWRSSSSVPKLFLLPGVATSARQPTTPGRSGVFAHRGLPVDDARPAKTDYGVALPGLNI